MKKIKSPEDLERLRQIAVMVKNERAPACAHCGCEASLSRQGSEIECGKCGTRYANLRAAWLDAVKRFGPAKVPR